MTSSLPGTARRWLEPALDPEQPFTWADVEARVLNNTAQLWLTDDCAMVTELIGDAIHVWLGGGSLRGLLTLRPRVEETARFWGFKRATIQGRPGWARALRAHGYRERGDELEKML